MLFSARFFTADVGGKFLVTIIYYLDLPHDKYQKYTIGDAAVGAFLASIVSTSHVNSLLVYQPLVVISFWPDTCVISCLKRRIV